MSDESNTSGISLPRRPSIREIIEQAKLALHLLRDGRVPMWQKLIPGLALVYLFSPIDLLPELIVGPLGMLDDVTIVALAIRLFIKVAPEDVVADHRPGGDDDGPISTSYRVRED